MATNRRRERRAKTDAQTDLGVARRSLHDVRLGRLGAQRQRRRDVGCTGRHTSHNTGITTEFRIQEGTRLRGGRRTPQSTHESASQEQGFAASRTRPSSHMDRSPTQPDEREQTRRACSPTMLAQRIIMGCIGTGRFASSATSMKMTWAQSQSQPISTASNVAAAKARCAVGDTRSAQDQHQPRQHASEQADRGFLEARPDQSASQKIRLPRTSCKRAGTPGTW